ncbi:MAG: hypothetical protein NT062_39260 [Proteobacteria bacterium]|nr:hypothetical protein [Pseudomonadota bacterium]
MTIRPGPIVIEREADLAAHLGQTVTLRGIVSRTKIPAIHGVEIDDLVGALADQLAEATGVLEAYELAEDVDRYAAHKGPGRHLVLRSDSGLARPRPVR